MKNSESSFILGTFPMFLPQASPVLSIFTGVNYSLPVHTTVVVMQGGMGLDFLLVVLDNTSQWMLDILKINRQTGEIKLEAGWKEMIWENSYHNKAKGVGKCLQNSLFANG